MAQSSVTRRQAATSRRGEAGDQDGEAFDDLLARRAYLTLNNDADVNPERIVEHVPRLRRYARALLGDRYAADDLVQDTLERAWNKFHLWRPGSDLRAWLFAIMHNVFVNQVRAAEAKSKEPSRRTRSAVRASQSDALELADVERASRGLPEEQREVLLLVAVEEMTYDEVSRALGDPGRHGDVAPVARARAHAAPDRGRAAVPLKVVK